MEALGSILALVTVIIVIAYVMQPFLAGRVGRSRRSSGGVDVSDLRRRVDLLAERNGIYRAIKELDFDYETGKFSVEDYAEQRHTLVAQGVDILQQLDALPAEPDDPVERAILRVREGGPVAIDEGVAPASGGEFCPQCGTPAKPGDKFCAKCGARI